MSTLTPLTLSGRPLTHLPEAQGLYDPKNEKDSCGVGFIANIKGARSHAIVADALEMLRRMDHRGACGCETNTGDGAGILCALPHEFFARVTAGLFKKPLPAEGAYAAGNLFFPREQAEREKAVALIEALAKELGLEILGWRELPVDANGADVGPSARGGEPVTRQLFVGKPAGLDTFAFERRLYQLRKRASHAIRNDQALTERKLFYVCSLSAGIIIYKGQLTSAQVRLYYPDLRETDFASHLAMVHSRFSTNTFPSWDRAQPLRWMSHNGEINTVEGNRNWMKARQGQCASPFFGADIRKLFPICEADTSDSGSFDNVLELLLMSGRSLPEAIMMMVPEAWENHEHMDPAKKDFYAFQANLMEPWDGPASISFSDGKYIGACLDRNGLRPSRYYLTHDDRVVMASEVGVVDIDPANVKAKGRLQPGRMFLVNFEEGRIVPDEELKQSLAAAKPWGEWLAAQRLEIDELPEQPAPAKPGNDALLRALRAFGYTVEHLHFLMLPMVRTSKEALGSMGNDAAFAVLSDKPRLLPDYFKQLFAQVTNPPIDPIREECVMSLETAIGPEKNLLAVGASHAHRLHLPSPILTDAQAAAIKGLTGAGHKGWTTATLDATMPVVEEAAAGAALEAALDRLCNEAEAAVAAGRQLIVLSDRAASATRVAVPALLATGAVHHHLVRLQIRSKAGLVVESGEPREVHQFCLLFGYGADAVNPYLAHQALVLLQDEGYVDAENIHAEEVLVARFHDAIGHGILKVMSKMGVSTLASYKGSQLFEAVGLGRDVIEKCFHGTASRLSGAGFDILGKEGLRRHALGFPLRSQTAAAGLPNPGEYHWRAGGESHAWSPKAIASVQEASRQGDNENGRIAYAAFAKTANEESALRSTLRGLLGVKSGNPVPLEEVESAKEIVKRFRTGAMSLGALSQEAHETLALAMNQIGGMSNSGEGGEDPVRFAQTRNADGSNHSKRSAIKQVASGRFGVTSHYLSNADVLQIKIAQGAKPGEGGQLPGFKVSDYIGKIRHSTPGVGLISPPPHHDIYSIEDLSQLIYDLKNANPAATISVKLVAEVGVGTIAAGVSKAHADHILISGHDGGTGASPLTSIKHAGLPWELGLAEAHQTLVMNNLRSRVRLEADGGFKTGRDVFIAACLGAEEYGFSTAPLIAVGCIMMRKCHLNTCPVGVCTQDPELRKKFTGTPEHVINYLFMVAEECRSYMAQTGIRKLDDLIGRVDLLEAKKAVALWKADGLDLAPLLTRPVSPYAGAGVRKTQQQEHAIDGVLDRKLIAQAQGALENGQRTVIESPITNLDRTVGTMLSHEVSKRHGLSGLADDSIIVRLRGSAGQSLGAWAARGVTLDVIGDANDYVGKGLSGGKIIVRPNENAGFPAEDNIIAGNVALYGATSGEAYFRGMVAERFCVRNSGAKAVVEGVGDHGCEYMTGGRVVILGRTGRNFAAGMSGGIAYVWDFGGDFITNVNLEMTELEKLDHGDDIVEVLSLVQNHYRYTGSPVAKRILENWQEASKQFVKVMPVDYRRVLVRKRKEFEANFALAGGVGHG